MREQFGEREMAVFWGEKDESLSDWKHEDGLSWHYGINIALGKKMVKMRSEFVWILEIFRRVWNVTISIRKLIFSAWIVFLSKL